MKKSLNKESLALIGISCLKSIASIFLGPFLVAYFIQKTESSISELAMFYMLSYLFSIILWYFIAWITNNKYKILMLRIGIVAECIYVLAFIILQEDVINYLVLIAFLNGASTASFYVPDNILKGDKVASYNRKSYEVIKETANTLIKIIIPITLGFMITSTNYICTAVIILILCVLELFLSFYIMPIKEYKKDTYSPWRWAISKIHDKKLRNIFLGEFLKGFTTCSGALGVIITIFIIDAFKTSANLGLITSFSYAISLALSFLYYKYFKKNDKFIITVCSVVPALLVLLLIFFTDNYTVLIYNLTYSALISILGICGGARLWNASESKLVKKTDRVEFWFIRELMLASGRIISYYLLFVITMYFSNEVLYGYMVVLALSLIWQGRTINKIDDCD